MALWDNEYFLTLYCPFTSVKSHPLVLLLVLNKIYIYLGLYYHDVVTDTLCKMGMVEQLMSLLRCEHAPYHEHVMRIIVNLAREHAPSLAECRRPELSFNEFLLQHVIDLRDKPEFQVCVVSESLS